MQDHYVDEQFMRRALDLAARGRGFVSPNPMVGSVIVHRNKIIGEGWHEKYGGPHAEVNAVKSVDDKSLLAESVLYVNLEPCSHHGKTPPCADMIVTHGIQKVVVSNLDSNPLVSGRGIKKLRDAGADVTTGILETEGRALNTRFFTWMEKKRPYIILKWAQTADGLMARENRDSKWISNEYSRQLVHKWRTEEDSILVGTGTAHQDNPQLNVRDWSGRNPARIVIDRHLKLDHGLHVFDGSQKTIFYNLIKDSETTDFKFIRLEREDFLKNLILDLYRQSIQSVIVEGGSEILNRFIVEGLWDEARVFTSDSVFHTGLSAPAFKGTLVQHETIVNDLLQIYLRSNTDNLDL